METRELATNDNAAIAYQFRPGRTHWVLLHGLGCDARMWSTVAAELAPDVGLIIPELRGHGDSTLGWKPPSVDQWAEDVAAIIRKEKVEHPAVAGLSMGGYTALALAAGFPGLARAYAFISTSAAPDDEAGRARRAAGLATVKQSGFRVFAEGLLPLMFVASHPEGATHRSLALEMFARAGDAGIASALFALANRPDRRPFLPSLRVPVRILVGDQDPLTPPARAREMAAALPQSQLTILAGVSHMSSMEAPAEVAAVIAST